LEFDRFSRYELVARAVRALAPAPGPVLDVGGAGGLLPGMLPEYRVVTVDLSPVGVDVVASGTALPFRDGAFAVATALDVFEHVEAGLRTPLLEELLRATQIGCVVAGPFANTEVSAAEQRVHDFYRQLTGLEHRWLSEHARFGLPDLPSLLHQAAESGWYSGSTTTNPLMLWERLQYANFIGSRSFDTDALDEVHKKLQLHYLNGSDRDSPAYRNVVVIVRSPEAVKSALSRLRSPSEVAQWSTEDAVSALDLAVLSLVRENNSEYMRVQRQVAQQSDRIAEQVARISALEASRKEQDVAVLEKNTRVEELQLELADAARVVAASRAALREAGDEIKQLALQRSAADERHRHVVELMERLVRDVQTLLTSRRWRIGDRLGELAGRARRGPAVPPPTAHIDATLEAYRGWKHGAAPSARAATAPKQNEHPAPPGGVLLAVDDAARRARYRRFVSDYESPPSIKGKKPSVRAFVLNPGRLRDARTQLACLRTVEACLSADLRVTVIDAALKHPEADELHVVTAEELMPHLAHVREEGLLFLLPGDVPSLHLRAGVAESFAREGQRPAVVLTDTDVLDRDGMRERPRMGGRLSPDLVVEVDVIGRGAIFSPSALTEAGIDSLDRDVVRDLVLRLHDAGQVIAKIDRILVHQAQDDRRRATVLADDASFTRRVLQRRSQLNSHVVVEPWGVRVAHRDPKKPLVSVIIPFKDKAELTRACVASIKQLTTYENFELLLVNNRSTEPDTAEFLSELVSDPQIRLLHYDRPFNYSKINNWAAGEAAGEVLVFLNNDTKILSPSWLDEFVGWSGQQGVGLVGAKLLLPDGRVQHAGVVIGVMGYAAHVFAGQHEPFIPHPEIRHTRSWSAVTGACAAIRKSTFDLVGGFDERFLVTGSDVELGLRLTRRGYRNIVVPAVTAFHHEKASRAAIPTKAVDRRLSLESYRPELEVGDPFWNRQLSAWSTAMDPRVDEHEDGFRQLLKRETALIEAEGTRVEATTGEAGFLRRYDASTVELEANWQHVMKFRENRNTALSAVTWFVPAFDHIYRGGIYTIMRLADYLTRQYGTMNNVIIIGKANVDVNAMRGKIREAFPDMKCKVIALGLNDTERSLPAADIGICTLWTSAYHLMRYNQCGGKFYLIQDYEPAFYAGGALQGLVTQTYRFGFDGIANTLGVGRAYAEYGHRTMAFSPAVDLNVFYPPEMPRRDKPIRVMFYGRPANQRNGFELGIQALRRVKAQWGDDVEIVSAGADFNVEDYGLQDVLENLGVLPDVEAVAAEYRRCDIGVVFMFSKHPSYQPLEYMASACVTVTNENEANRWLYKQRRNVLLAPSTVTAVADAAGEAIGDAELRSSIVRGGLATVRALSWERELAGIARFLTTGEGALPDPGEGRNR
jgi:GT2 family glycosyltransferase/glycosyltransferase involved in cell wall biosynthesis